MSVRIKAIIALVLLLAVSAVSYSVLHKLQLNSILDGFIFPILLVLGLVFLLCLLFAWSMLYGNKETITFRKTLLYGGVMMYLVSGYACASKISIFLASGIKIEVLSNLFVATLFYLSLFLFFWIQKKFGFFSDPNGEKMNRPILFTLVILVMVVLAFSDLIISNKYGPGCDAYAQRKCENQFNFNECYSDAYGSCEDGERDSSDRF